MINSELITYITTERAKGVADSDIKAHLLTQGWNEADFAEAVIAISSPTQQNGMTDSQSMLKTSATSGKKIISPELKAYRSKSRWRIFGIAWILPLFYWITVSVSSGASPVGIFSPILLWYIVIAFLVMYLAASLVSRGMTPKNSAGKEFFNILLNGIVTAVISFIFLVGAVFVFCLVLFSAGGLGGL